LFNLDNLKNNRYLINNANVNFEIPLNAIYDERNIKAISFNRELINQAMKKVDKLEILKNGCVKPKHEPKRDKIIIKHINRLEETKVIQLVLQIPEYKDSVTEGHVPKYDSKLQTVTIECKDNTAAKILFNVLNNTKFQDSPIDCLLNEESLYIACLENINRGPIPSYNQPLQNRYVKYNQPQYVPQYNQQQFMFGPYNPYYMNTMYQQSTFPTYVPTMQPRQNTYYNNYPRKYNGAGNGTEVSNNFNNNYGGKKRYYAKDYNKNSNYQYNGRYNNSQGQKNPKELNFDQQNFPPLSE